VRKPNPAGLRVRQVRVRSSYTNAFFYIWQIGIWQTGSYGELTMANRQMAKRHMAKRRIPLNYDNETTVAFITVPSLKVLSVNHP